ncbi:hypothetical protein K8R33_03110 [archaeon]|nr:hypothetical protein [archaeon]
MVKKKKKTQTKKKEPIYVKIENALSVRKQILEAAIEASSLLKRLESYKLLREMKLQQIKDLKKLMNKIDKEFSGFTRDLPKIKLEEEIEELQEEEKPVKAKGLSEIDIELEEIKRKLAQLRV